MKIWKIAPVLLALLAPQAASGFAFRAKPQPPTVASTVYIDPSAGGGGDGSCATPFNTWAGRTLTGNVAFLQKAGTTFTTGASPGLSTSGAGTGVYTPLILGTYVNVAGVCSRITDGSQTAAINANGNARAIQISHSYVTVNSLEIYGATQMAVYADTATPLYTTVSNSNIHDITGGDGQNAAVLFFSPYGQIINNVIARAGGDGIFAQGRYLILTGNNISAVSLDAAFGDGIQVSDDFINSNDPYIARNTITHTSVDIKSCIFVFGSAISAGGQVLLTTCVEITNAANQGGIGFGYPNMTIAGNRISEGWRGIDILASATGCRITGNVVTNTSVVSLVKGLANNGAAGCVIANNVFVNTTGTFGAQTTGLSNSASDVVTNNIIVGWKNGITGSPTDSFNDCFANQTSGCAGSGTITTDPLFVGSGATPYNLQGGSGAKGAGTNPSVVVRTPTGIVMTTPFDMGAYWASAP